MLQTVSPMLVWQSFIFDRLLNPKYLVADFFQFLTISVTLLRSIQTTSLVNKDVLVPTTNYKSPNPGQEESSKNKNIYIFPGLFLEVRRYDFLKGN